MNQWPPAKRSRHDQYWRWRYSWSCVPPTSASTSRPARALRHFHGSVVVVMGRAVCANGAVQAVPWSLVMVQCRFFVGSQSPEGAAWEVHALPQRQRVHNEVLCGSTHDPPSVFASKQASNSTNVVPHMTHDTHDTRHTQHTTHMTHGTHMHTHAYLCGWRPA